jgi:hypothetical protein
MGVFGAMIKIQMLPMFAAKQKLSVGGTVALELICGDYARYIRQVLEQLPKECLRRGFIPSTLDQAIKDVAVLIYRPPEMMPYTMDGERHFISKPNDLSLSSRKNCDKA